MNLTSILLILSLEGYRISNYNYSISSSSNYNIIDRKLVITGEANVIVKNGYYCMCVNRYISNRTPFNTLSFAMFSTDHGAIHRFDGENDMIQRFLDSNNNVLIFPLIMDEVSCTHKDIILNNSYSDVCYKDLCIQAKKSIPNPFKLTILSSITINGSELLCSELLECDDENNYIFYQCYSSTSKIIILIIGFIALLMISLIMVITCCCILKKFRPSMTSSRTENLRNARYKTVGNVKRTIVNSRAPNTTHRKISTKHKFSLCSMMVICLMGIEEVKSCSSTYDIYTTTRRCDQNKCQNFVNMRIFTTKRNDDICFYDDKGFLNIISVNKVIVKCVKDILYYVPNYKVRLETDWVCSGSKDCKSGEFKNHLNDSFHIDIARPHSPFDGCIGFDKTDECKRIYAQFDPMEKYCTVSKCSKPLVEIHMTVISNEFKGPIRLFDGESKILSKGTSVRAWSIDRNTLPDKIITCGDYYYKSIANKKGEYSNDKYGLIQCESKEDAIKLNREHCFTNPNHLIQVLEDRATVSRIDDISSLRYTKNKINIREDDSLLALAGIDIEYLIDIEYEMISEIVWPYSNTTGMGVTNIIVKGFSNKYKGAVISFSCTLIKKHLILECDVLFVVNILCKEIGNNSEIITINNVNNFTQLNCVLHDDNGFSEMIQVILLTKDPLTELFGSEYSSWMLDISPPSFIEKINPVIWFKNQAYHIGYYLLLTLSIIIGLILISCGVKIIFRNK